MTEINNANGDYKIIVDAANGDFGVKTSSGSGAMNFEAGGSNGDIDFSTSAGAGNVGITTSSGGGNFSIDLTGSGSGTLGLAAKGDLSISSSAGQIMMTGLPTSDPGVAGALWDNAGVLSVSQ